MSTDKSFIGFVAEQMQDAGQITFRAMFGEYAVYCGGKVVALVCGNRVYVKPTKSGREFIGKPKEGPPYSGAKMYFVVDDKLDDRDWISELVRITAKELPPPKTRSPLPI